MDIKTQYGDFSNKRTIRFYQSAIENLPMGIIKIDAEGNVTYANSEMCNLLGDDNLTGKHLRDFFDNDENLAKVMENLDQRIYEESADEYQVEMKLKRGRKLPVQILAIPEIDHNGRFLNSLGLVRNLSVQRISKTIHKHIASLDGIEILESVARDLQHAIPFDFMSVVFYSDDRRSIRPFYSYPLDEGQVQIRWWDIPEIAVNMMDDTSPHIIEDIHDFLNQQYWKEIMERAETQEFLTKGYHSCLRFPILGNNLPIAAVSLYSKETGYYTGEDIEFIDQTPMQHAVIKALRYEAKRESAFRLKLLKDISMIKSGDVETMAQVICDDIQKHYGWDNVAFFRVEEDSGEFRLLRQAAANSNCLAPEDFRQDIGEGMLSETLAKKEPIKICDLSRNEKYKDCYLPLFNKNAESEVCIPIIVEGRVILILNIEDTRRNAISEQEHEILWTTAKEVSSSLESVQLLKSSQRIEILRDLHYELAMQTKTPLSIAFSTLSKLRDKPDISGDIRKVLQYLERVDLTFNRLMMYDMNLERDQDLIPYNESMLNIRKIINEMKSDLPMTEAKAVYIVPPDSESSEFPRVRADLYQISFCIESILSYLLRMATEKEMITVQITADEDNIIVRFRGLAPNISSDNDRNYSDTRLAGQTLVNLALGADIIGKFIKNAGGQLYKPEITGAELEIIFSIPSAKG